PRQDGLRARRRPRSNARPLGDDRLAGRRAEGAEAASQAPAEAGEPRQGGGLVADTVQTATGPVAAGDLGTTLIHEHVRFRDEAVAEQWPDRYDGSEEYSLAVEAVQAALERGVKTICEPTAMFGGRDIDFIRRVAEETGAQIV